MSENRPPAPGEGAPSYGLGPEWPPGPDGIPYREAARVVVLDAAGRALLVRGHDRHDPDYFWWFTVGGGRMPGEEPRRAACRELAEETGIFAEPADLEGPVLRRESLFEFSTITCRQDEDFFLLRLDRRDDALGVAAQDGWTELEREVLDELAWWSAEDLAAVRAQGTLVFPRGLPEFITRWRAGPAHPDAAVPLVREIDE